MDFELSEDEVALAEGMRRLCAGRFPLERIRAAEGERVVMDGAGWSELAEAGVFSLRLAEDGGGLGLPMAAAAVVFEELGRALVPGPILSSHLAAGVVEGAADGKVMVGAVSRSPGQRGSEGHGGSQDSGPSEGPCIRCAGPDRRGAPGLAGRAGGGGR